jgi:hypothetical protein
LHSAGALAASAGVNLPHPIRVDAHNQQGEGTEFTFVLTDLTPRFPNTSQKGSMGLKELKVWQAEAL